MNTDADWKKTAVEALKQGSSVQIRPRGHSMTGLINDNDLATLAPCRACDLAAGDAVPARVHDKHFSHVVLHKIVAVEQDGFLIGSNNRLDGWVGHNAILGKVVQVVHAD